jgi:hypothetical protein
MKKEKLAVLFSDDSVAEFLRNYLAEFHAFIARVCMSLPRDA